jgi:antitoxin ParD1/3/4
MNITLPADLENFVQSLVVSGSYSDPDAVVGKAIAMLKRHEELRREIQIGIDQLDRGECTEYDENSFQRFSDDIKATEATIFGQEPRKP